MQVDLIKIYRNTSLDSSYLFKNPLLQGPEVRPPLSPQKSRPSPNPPLPSLSPPQTHLSAPNFLLAKYHPSPLRLAQLSSPPKFPNPRIEFLRVGRSEIEFLLVGAPNKVLFLVGAKHDSIHCIIVLLYYCSIVVVVKAN